MQEVYEQRFREDQKQFEALRDLQDTIAQIVEEKPSTLNIATGESVKFNKREIGMKEKLLWDRLQNGTLNTQDIKAYLTDYGATPRESITTAALTPSQNVFLEIVRTQLASLTFQRNLAEKRAKESKTPK